MDISSATSREEHIEPFSARYSTARIPYSTEALKCTVSLVPISCSMFQAGTDGIYPSPFLANEIAARPLSRVAFNMRSTGFPNAQARLMRRETQRRSPSLLASQPQPASQPAGQLNRCRVSLIAVVAITGFNEYAYILAQAIILYFIAMLFHTMLRFRPPSRNTI